MFSYCTYNCFLPEFVFFSLSVLISSVVLGNPRSFCLGAWNGRMPQQQCSCIVEISWWCLASAVYCTMLCPGSSPTLRVQLCHRAWTKHFLQTFLLAQSLSTALMRTGRSVPSTCSLPALIWLFGRCWLRVRNFQRNLGQMERSKHSLKTVTIRRTAEPRDINQIWIAETGRLCWSGLDRHPLYGIGNSCNHTRNHLSVLGLINVCRTGVVLLAVRNRLGERKTWKGKGGEVQDWDSGD